MSKLTKKQLVLRLISMIIAFFIPLWLINNFVGKYPIIDLIGLILFLVGCFVEIKERKQKKESYKWIIFIAIFLAIHCYDRVCDIYHLYIE